IRESLNAGSYCGVEIRVSTSRCCWVCVRPPVSEYGRTRLLRGVLPSAGCIADSFVAPYAAVITVLLSCLLPAGGEHPAQVSPEFRRQGVASVGHELGHLVRDDFHVAVRARQYRESRAGTDAHEQEVALGQSQDHLLAGALTEQR